MATSTLKKEEEAISAKDPEVPNSDPSKSLSPVKGDSKEPSLPTPSPTKKTPGPSEPSTKSKHSSELSLPALDGVKDQPKIPVSARSQPFPGPRKNQVHSGLALAKQPERQALQTRIANLQAERRALLLEGTQYVNAALASITSDLPAAAKHPPPASRDGRILPEIPNVLKNYQATPSRQSRTRQNSSIPVTYFVDTDFGFHEERGRQSAGMSLHKHFGSESDLQKDICSVARRHISVIQTPSLNYRASKNSEGLANLREVLFAGLKIKPIGRRHSIASRGELGLPRSTPRTKGACKSSPATVLPTTPRTGTLSKCNHKGISVVGRNAVFVHAAIFRQNRL